MNPKVDSDRSDETKGRLQAAQPGPNRLQHAREQDDIYFVLSNYRRRFVLEYLETAESSITLRELAEALAAWENGVDTEETIAVQRKRAYVSLRQTHLPKMDELGVVRFDNIRGTIERGPAMDDVAPYLSDETAGGTGQGLLYAGLAVAVTLVLSFVVVGLIGF